MTIFYTYLYTDPNRNEPIYVGKGKGNRAWVHSKRKDKHPFVQRLQKMRREGIEPIITFLCKDVDEELALLCEEMAIEKYGRKDLGKGPLLNLSDGGEGSSGHIKSLEVRAQHSAALKGRVNGPHSLETRQKQSTAKLGVPRSEETKAKLRKPKSEATKAKLKASAALRWARYYATKETQ